MAGPSQYKRKRAAGPSSALMVYKPYGKSAYKRPRQFVPGKDRVGGYYGRYRGEAGELKFHDIDVDDATIAGGGVIQKNSIVGIAQGTGESERNGRKCTIKHISWTWSLELPTQDAAATPGGGDTVRLIVYLDKQTNGATAQVANIFESDNFQSYRNLANQGRFDILYDKTITLNRMTLASDNNAVVSEANVYVNGKFDKACNIPLEFDNVTGAIAEMKTNNISIMTFSDAGVTTMASKVRVRFRG